jgi:quercetin dioxygenase-like cupin family protein
MTNPKKIVITAPNEGQKLTIAGGEYRILVSGKQTDGAFAVIEMSVPPEAGPDPHSHPNFEESFYVLEGEIYFRTESGEYTAKPTSFINIPRGGMVHGFKNLTKNNAKLLCTVIPAGLDEFFYEVSNLMAEAKKNSYQPAEIKQHIDFISEKYGQKLFSPDYLD